MAVGLFASFVPSLTYTYYSCVSPKVDHVVPPDTVVEEEAHWTVSVRSYYPPISIFALYESVTVV